MGGFDTHANEKGAQAILLGTVSSAISKFITQVKKTKYGNDITVLVYSEFGRRVVANASDGTDHGTSGPMFLIGEKVNGGFFGDQPNLKNLVNGDLEVTTDFRDVYSTIIEKVLQTESERVIPNWKNRLNLLNYK